ERFPRVGRCDHAGEELCVEPYDRSRESGRCGALCGTVGGRCRRKPRTVCGVGRPQRELSSRARLLERHPVRTNRSNTYARCNFGAHLDEERTAGRGPKERVALTVVLREYAQQAKISAGHGGLARGSRRRGGA